MTIRIDRVFLSQEFKGRKPLLVPEKNLQWRVCSTTNYQKKVPKIFRLTGLSFQPTSTATDLGTWPELGWCRRGRWWRGLCRSPRRKRRSDRTPSAWPSNSRNWNWVDIEWDWNWLKRPSDRAISAGPYNSKNWNWVDIELDWNWLKRRADQTNNSEKSFWCILIGTLTGADLALKLATLTWDKKNKSTWKGSCISQLSPEMETTSPLRANQKTKTE